MTTRASNDTGALTPEGSTGRHGPDAHQEDLPADPFVALRVAYGMLLGEDDFQVMMGNARGKLRMHAAWAHGPGVFWGYRVSYDEEHLAVAPGLAVDGLGRELRLRVSHCKHDLAEWAGQTTAADGTTTERAWLVARYASELSKPVPAMADPCDLTRTHDAFSRVVESVRVELTREPPDPPALYPRLHRLLGITEAGPVDKEVREALEKAAEASPDKRRAALRDAVGRLATRDATERKPATEPGHTEATENPVATAGAGVVLAELAIKVTRKNGSVTVKDVRVRERPGVAAVPTAVMFELLTDLIARHLRHDPSSAAAGPRLVEVVWPGSDADTVRLTFDKPVLPRTALKAVAVTSLADDGQGWHREDVSDVDADKERTRLVVRLDDSQHGRRVRVLVRGTGPMPLLGGNAAPFAGWADGVPTGGDDGRDAADMRLLPRRPYAEEESS